MAGSPRHSVSRVVKTAWSMYQSSPFATALGAYAGAFALCVTIGDAIGIAGSVSFFGVSLLLSYVPGSIGYFAHSHILHQGNPSTRMGIAKPGSATRSRTIAVIAPVSYWSTEYYVEIIKAVRAAADRRKDEYRKKILVIDVSSESFPVVEDAVEDALSGNVAGLITINLAITKSLKQLLLQHNVPIVCINHFDTDAPTVANILPDHGPYIQRVQDLVGSSDTLGAILVAKSPMNNFKNVHRDPFRIEKIEAFRTAARRRGLQIVEVDQLDALNAIRGLDGQAVVVSVSEYTEGVGTQVFSSLAANLKRGIVVICLADIVAAGFMHAARRHSRDCRLEGVRVLGFDNLALCNWFDLSSVDYQLGQVGALAYGHLERVLNYPGAAFVEERVPTLICERGSTSW